MVTHHLGRRLQSLDSPILWGGGGAMLHGAHLGYIAIAVLTVLLRPKTDTIPFARH